MMKLGLQSSANISQGALLVQEAAVGVCGIWVNIANWIVLVEAIGSHKVIGDTISPVSSEESVYLCSPRPCIVYPVRTKAFRVVELGWCSPHQHLRSFYQ